MWFKRGRASLRFLLILPFIIQLLLALGISSYLAVRNARSAVVETVIRLENRISQQVYNHLKEKLENVLLVNEINRTDYSQGILDLSDKEKREQYFVNRLRLFPSILYTFIGTPAGGFYGAMREADGEERIFISDETTGQNSRYFDVTPRNTAGEFLKEYSSFDPRTRPWYSSGIDAHGEPVFSEIYKHFVISDLAVTASLAVYHDDGSLAGVFGVDLVLDSLRRFLQEIKIAEGGVCFIGEMDTGNIVSSSTEEPLFLMEDGEFKRLAMGNCVNPLIRRTWGAAEQGVAPTTIRGQGPVLVQFTVDRDPMVAQLYPYREYGLEWVIGVIIPEKAFTRQLRMNTLFTVLIITVVILLSTLLGLYITAIIVRPIEIMNQYARRLAAGEWGVEVPPANFREFNTFVAAFNRMSEELKSFVQALEMKVEERTVELKIRNKELLEANRQKEAAMKAKSDFLANMSHEIRTPLNAILGFSEFLHEREGEKEKREYISYILSSGRTLLSLINDILDLSKIEADKMRIRNEPMDIVETAYDIRQIFSIKADEKKIHLNLSFSSDMPRWFILDPVRIRQILFNLVGNAVKFTQEGSVCIRLETKGSERKKATRDLILSVEDTGIGIAENELQAIFESFNQSESGNSAKYGGTGLGLSITKRLTELMNGTIHVKNRLGGGSIFTVHFKDIPLSQTPKPKDESILPMRYQFKRGKVFIVDDVKENRVLIRDFLKRQGINSEDFERGEDLLEKLKKEKPNLLLLDLKMPGLDGYTLLKQVREDEEIRDVPVIAVSASVGEEQRENVSKAGFDGFIGKPVIFSELLTTIALYLPHTVPSDSSPGDGLINSGFRVLLVDDELISRKVFLSQLKDQDIHIDTADSIAKGLERIKTGSYDFIFLDMELGDGRGTDLAEEIRRRGIMVPVYALTAHSADAEIENVVLRSGMNGILTKPLVKAEVLSLFRLSQE